MVMRQLTVLAFFHLVTCLSLARSRPQWLPCLLHARVLPTIFQGLATLLLSRKIRREPETRVVTVRGSSHVSLKGQEPRNVHMQCSEGSIGEKTPSQCIRSPPSSFTHPPLVPLGHSATIPEEWRKAGGSLSGSWVVKAECDITRNNCHEEAMGTEVGEPKGEP